MEDITFSVSEEEVTVGSTFPSEVSQEKEEEAVEESAPAEESVEEVA